MYVVRKKKNKKLCSFIDSSVRIYYETQSTLASPFCLFSAAKLLSWVLSSSVKTSNWQPACFIASLGSMKVFFVILPPSSRIWNAGRRSFPQTLPTHRFTQRRPSTSCHTWWVDRDLSAALKPSSHFFLFSRTCLSSRIRADFVWPLVQGPGSCVCLALPWLFTSDHKGCIYRLLRNYTN